MDNQPLHRLDAPVPRYTSYPTTAHFGPTVSAETYGRWLAAIGGGDSLSLYFHVPFCEAMCWYCGCHTKIVNRYRPVHDYTELLAREIALVAARIPAAPSVVHVHWGGGTPTMLRARDFSRLMAAARKHFHFAADAEVAVEIDPRTLTRSMARTLARAGVARASLGVQDVNAHVQEAVNRIQPFAVTEQAVRWLREAGIDAINLDLMYGLPRQRVEDVVRTVDLVRRLRPDRLAVFGYAHVPWMKAHQRLIDADALPDGPERLAQMAAASERLAALGYRAIGLDHFAREGDSLVRAFDRGRLRRNFQGYTADRAQVLLGFGASAIGSLRDGYVQNEVPIRDYARAIETGRLASVRGIELSDDDRLRRAVIERLMCGLEVDLRAEARRFGSSERFAAEMAGLAPLAAEGLVTIGDGRIRVTEAGRPWMRVVAARFDRYLERGTGKYSRAV